MNFLSDLYERIRGIKEVQILIRYSDWVGKTGLLYRLYLGYSIETRPTNGLNVEILKYKTSNLLLLIWAEGTN